MIVTFVLVSVLIAGAFNTAQASTKSNKSWSKIKDIFK